MKPTAIRRRRPAPPRLELLEGRRLPSGLVTVPFEGTGVGLLGHYYRTADLTGEAGTRVDAAVNFDWTATPPPAPLARHDFSVLWTGEVQPQFSETYTFSARSDDGVRLWVDGRQLIDDWTDHAARQDAGAVTLVAGRKYDIVVEYYENAYGPALVQLSWSSSSRAKEIIPQRFLYPGPPAAASLSGFVTLGPGGASASGAEGARITLAGEDDQGDAVSRTTTTADDGSYRFAGLRPGVYELTRGGSGGVTSAADVIAAIRLSPGERGEGYDFTIVPPPAPPRVAPPPAVPATPPPAVPATPPPAVRASPPAVLLLPKEEMALAGPAPAPPPLTPLRVKDAVFILAGAFAPTAAPGGGGGAGAAADDNPPTLPPPAVAPQMYGRALPAAFLEEDEAVVRAAADEVFMEPATVPAYAGALFGTPASPSPRRVEVLPAPDDPNSVGRTVLLASAWMLTTVGAALANPLDYSRRASRP